MNLRGYAEEEAQDTDFTFKEHIVRLGSKNDALILTRI